MVKKLVLVISTLLLFTFTSTVFAGYGQCKRCSCYGYNDRGDLICDCGHGYGMHR